MAKNIEPKLRKIGDYLKLEEDAVFVIPEYQRPYSWGIENCDKLWQDIVDFSENKNKDNYFFGTIIVNCQDDDTRYELIDGQQRTTTFLLLFKALLLGINNSIARINSNDEDSSGLLNGLKERRRRILGILYKAEPEEISERPNIEKDIKIYEKLNLLSNESNNEQFKNELNIILKAIDFEDAERKVYKIPYKQKDNKYTNFFKNFKFFYNKIFALQGSEVNSIAKSIIDNCEVIEIKSWQVEQAITMFNSLNSDGMPLNDADIISAKLFATSKSLNKGNEYSKIWKDLLEQLNDDKISNIIDINSILTQYMYLTRAKNGKMIADTTVPGVRRYFTQINTELIKAPIETCSEMFKLAQIWGNVYNYPIIKILLKCNENAKLFLGCYFNRFLNKENRIVEVDIIILAETMLRLFVILELVDAGYSSKYFKSFLFKEAIKLTDINVSINEIIEDFNLHIKENWKDKSDIEIRIHDYDKNLLVYVNEYLFAKENNMDFRLSSKCDIEHIMPASGHNLPEIRKDAGIKDEKEFNEIVNKLGNKILLEEKINRSIGNEWFRTKISNTLSDKFSYIHSSYPLASSLANKYKDIEKPYWDKDDIESATQKAIRRISNFIFED